MCFTDSFTPMNKKFQVQSYFRIAFFFLPNPVCNLSVRANVSCNSDQHYRCMSCIQTSCYGSRRSSFLGRFHVVPFTLYVALRSSMQLTCNSFPAISMLSMFLLQNLVFLLSPSVIFFCRGIQRSLVAFLDFIICFSWYCEEHLWDERNCT
jgi:hypothetical protein